MSFPTVRRCVFWGHLVIGVLAGLVILVLAITGILMAFETQIIASVERSMVKEMSYGMKERLSAEELVVAFERSGIREKPGTLQLSSHPEDPVAFLVGRGNQQLLHPTTGDFLGKGAVRTRAFFQKVLSLHRWLTLAAPAPEGQGGAWKKVGGQITAAGALLFLGLLLSGLILWIPKKRTRAAFKAVSLVNRKLKGRARDWNWHNVAGIWASPLILVTTVTGLIMAYPWANRLLFQAYGETPPVKQGAPGGKAEGRGDGKMSDAPREERSLAGLNQAVETAKQQMPAWVTLTIDVNGKADQPFAITATDAGRGRPDRRVKYSIDRQSFAVLSSEGFEKNSPATQMRQIVRWSHTGEFGGLWGQALAAFVCLCAIVLVWTGFALSWRRLFNRRKASPAVIE